MATGDFGDNIRNTYMHLDSNANSPPDPGDIDNDLWTAALEEAAGPVQELCDEAAHAAIDGTPACTFADQEEAFEHMSLEWFGQVLQGWGAPRWVIAMASALTAQRAVRSVTGD